MTHLVRRRFAAVAAIAVMLLATALPTSALPPPPSTRVQEILHRHRTNQVEGMHRGDSALLAAPGTETSRLLVEAHPTLVGTDAIAGYHRAFLACFDVPAYTREATGQFDLGPTVIETGRVEQRLVVREGGRTFDLIGKYLDAWEKMPDGGLRLIVSAINYDAWSPVFEEMRFSQVPGVRTSFQPRTPITDDLTFELAGLCLLIEKAVAEHDAKLWSRLYADDAALFPNNSPARLGRGAIDDYLTLHCRELPVFEKLDIRNDRVEVWGDYVFEYASHIANYRTADASGVSTGKNLRIWRREPSHALKMIFQIGAYD